jgi:pimeloyl-ACP methyl ester carboxylesterase
MAETTTYVLVPGYWLGGWAWDAVAERLRESGYVADPVTLPGLAAADRDAALQVTLDEQITAVVSAVHRADGHVVLVGHSDAGALISGAADLTHEMIDDLVFVDSGPAGDGAVAAPDLPAEVSRIDLPTWVELERQGSSLDGLDDGTLKMFRDRAVPHPAGPAREPLALHDDARHKLPVTLVCTSYSATQVRELTDAGHPWFAELAQFDDVRLIDLPTGHWPMWSRPDDLADVLRTVAQRSTSAG